MGTKWKTTGGAFLRAGSSSCDATLTTMATRGSTTGEGEGFDGGPRSRRAG